MTSDFQENWFDEYIDISKVKILATNLIVKRILEQELAVI
jgi:hypothetical protein